MPYFAKLCRLPRHAKHGDADRTPPELSDDAFDPGASQSAEMHALPSNLEFLHHLPHGGTAMKQSTLVIAGAGIVFSLAFVSCGQGPSGENYSNIKSLPDIVLTISNHPHGYQQTQCFYCHVKQNIHQTDTLGSGELPTAIALTNSSGSRHARPVTGRMETEG